MSRRLLALLKLVLIVGLMWWVFAGIDFQDRLVWVEPGTKEPVSEQVVTLRSSWQAEEVRYTVGDESAARVAVRGEVRDGLELDIQPGFLTYWSGLQPWWFALGALCYFVTVLITGSRWWWLLRVNGTGVSLLETLRLTWIGVFFNSMVLGLTGGDVIKALYIMKRCPGHRVQVLVSIAVDRVLGLTSLALLGAFVVLFELAEFKEVAVGIWGVILGVGIAGTVAFSRRLRDKIRLEALLEKLPPKIGHLLKLIDQAVFFYRDHKVVIVGSLLVGVVIHVISVLSVVFIGRAVGMELPWFVYFALIPVINIVSAIPIAPNGWGVGEFMYRTLFAKYGAVHLSGLGASQAAQVMGTRGVALSVLYRLHLTFWSLLGGLMLVFEKDRVTKADIQREAEREQQEDRDPPVDPPIQQG